jgi:hypothetical protein
MAGFEVITYGHFWLTPEAMVNATTNESERQRLSKFEADPYIEALLLVDKGWTREAIERKVCCMRVTAKLLG